LASKGKIVIFIKKLIFSILVRIVIFTKLLVSWNNYLEMIIIQCFGGLMSSNFLKFVSKSINPNCEY